MWLWDTLGIRLVPELFDLAEGHKRGLTVVPPPGHAPGFDPAEGVWSLIRRGLTGFAADLAHLTRVVKRHLKRIRYRPDLIDGCLAQTGLTLEPP